MPLDSQMYNDDDYFCQRAVWYPAFAWLPKRCIVSDRLIWLKTAYKGSVMWTGPGSPIMEYKWISKENFLFARISGKL